MIYLVQKGVVSPLNKHIDRASEAQGLLIRFMAMLPAHNTATIKAMMRRPGHIRSVYARSAPDLRLTSGTRR